MRSDHRTPDQMRPVRMTAEYLMHPEGSCLVAFGDTKVICTATVTEGVPTFMKGKGIGWVTAEYSMLPRATANRTQREREGKVNGRSQEISRLIGRSLRAVIDQKMMGEYTVTIDCDVIQADGGTRTAAISGGYVALFTAFERMVEAGLIDKNPVIRQVAALSVGVVDGEVLVDLNYEEDSSAEVDMNVIMTSEGGLIEIQGCAERVIFSRDRLNEMLDAVTEAMEDVFHAQRRAIGDI